MPDLNITPGGLTLEALEAAYREADAVRIDSSARSAVDAAAAVVAGAADADEPAYGVNTGFGKLASIRIAREDAEVLQRNLVLSHCAGTGEALEPEIVRLMMILKLQSFCRGASGVGWRLVEQLAAMVHAGIMPVIPVQGSVGASGDLAPLAHMSAVLIGEGEAHFRRRRMTGGEALAAAGLKPVVLGPKEGLALVNGTQFSTALALAGLFDAWRCLDGSIVIAALATDAVMGSTGPFAAEVHDLRGHAGQIDVARQMRALTAGSELRDSRVQDPYCIRCQPQVTGAAVDLMRFAARTLLTEANAATDNPLVLLPQGRIVSGGNFHGEPVAFAADLLALAIAEIGSIAQRRIALMVDPSLSCDVPPFLARHPGVDSGYMAAEISSAALMSENRHLANPCSTDTTPTSANQEDHVSMSAHAARRLRRMSRNLAGVLGIEAMCAAAGIEFRAPLRTSMPLRKVVARLRRDLPAPESDHYLAPDMEAAVRLVVSGELAASAGVAGLGFLDGQRDRSP